MTANAMKRHREKSLAAGMDDYISKPVEIDKLLNMLNKWTMPISSTREDPMDNNCSFSPTVREPEAAGASDRCPVDLAQAMDNLGGDRKLFDEVLAIFVRTIPALLEEVRSSIATRDVARLKLVAHGLKGSAANVCAEPARRAAEKLEALAKKEDFRSLDRTFGELEAHLKDLQKYVETLKSDGTPADSTS
jgi:two-component system sensor histidine kinase/response regulator